MLVATASITASVQLKLLVDASARRLSSYVWIRSPANWLSDYALLRIHCFCKNFYGKIFK